MGQAANQVDPFGEAHLLPGHRSGTFTGNWDFGRRIICTLDEAWRVEGRSYLRLFFLDEATALTAGFRPCGRCRKPETKEFSSSWAKAFGLAASLADIDAELSESVSSKWTSACNDLPSGAMIEVDEVVYLVVDGTMRSWSFSGYGPPQKLPLEAVVVTPEPTVRVMLAGYEPQIHPSVRRAPGATSSAEPAPVSPPKDETAPSVDSGSENSPIDIERGRVVDYRIWHKGASEPRQAVTSSRNEFKTVKAALVGSCGVRALFRVDRAFGRKRADQYGAPLAVAFRYPKSSSYVVSDGERVMLTSDNLSDHREIIKRLDQGPCNLLTEF